MANEILTPFQILQARTLGRFIAVIEGLEMGDDNLYGLRELKRILKEYREADAEILRKRVS